MATIHDIVRAAQEAERLHRQLIAPHAEALRSFERITSATDAFRQVQEQVLLREAMLGKIGPDLSALARPAFDASRSIAALLDTARIDRSIALYKTQMLEAERAIAGIDKFKATIATDWLKQLRMTEAIKEAAAFPIQAHLAKLYEWSAVAESSLARVRSDFFGIKLGLEAAELAALVARHDDFGSQYRALFGKVEGSDLGVLEVPALLTELPAGEFVNQTALVVSTSEAEPDEETAEAQREVTSELATETSDHLTTLIADLNPELTDLLNGARAAYSSRHADYVRHFVTSYRELFTHILHALSPDDDLRKWSNDPKHFDRNKPTRRARLLYITRDLAPAFGGFLNADVEAVVKFIDVFQKGTHGIKPKFADEQLFDMKNRTEGLLRFMLTVYQVTVFGKR